MVLVLLGTVLSGPTIPVNLFAVKCRVWSRRNGGYSIVADFSEVVCKASGTTHDAEHLPPDILPSKDSQGIRRAV